MLLDDEEDFLEAMSQRMGARGMEVRTTTYPNEALKMAEEEPFDAVVMDLMLPEMDGLQVLQELRRINPRLRVILLTGYATAEKRAEAKNLGAVDLVEKPADIDILTHRIRRVGGNRMEQDTPEKGDEGRLARKL